MASRLERMLGPETPRGLALEIGALAWPLLRRPEHDVLYVDYSPTEVVKANQHDPSVPIDQIVDVDIVWGDRPLIEAVGRQVDYIAASHVIEHVPDLIGWLNELAAVLKPGGVLGLIIPDKRFTFDALRRETVIADAVEAWLLASKQPSLRQVYDVAANGVAVDASQVWAGQFEPQARRAEVLQRLPSALDLVRSLRDKPRYKDAHCWVFTPESFLTLAEEMTVLRTFPFRIDAFYATEPGSGEFHLRLTRLSDAGDPAIPAAIATARAQLPSEATDDGDQVSRAAAKALQTELEAIRASTSWKVTAPLRALGRLLGR